MPMWFCPRSNHSIINYSICYIYLFIQLVTWFSNLTSIEVLSFKCNWNVRTKRFSPCPWVFLVNDLFHQFRFFSICFNSTIKFVYNYCKCNKAGLFSGLIFPLKQIMLISIKDNQFNFNYFYGFICSVLLFCFIVLKNTYLYCEYIFCISIT